MRNCQLKVTPPNELNDPLEFSPYVAEPVTKEHIGHLMTTVEPREVWADLVSKGQWSGSFDEFKDHLQDVIPLLVEYGEPTYQKVYEEKLATTLDSISQTMGLICFSEEENNILLWSHYTDSHQGMVLEFDTTHNYFKNNSQFFKVTYSLHRVPFKPSQPDEGTVAENYTKEVFCTKNIAWNYEREWRALFPLDWCHKKNIKGQTRYFTDIPPDLVSKVILGHRCPQQFQQEMLDLKRARNAQFEIGRAYLHPREFRLEYKPVG